MDEEATERGVILLTPEVIKPTGGVRRNLTGKTSFIVSHSFSNSDEKPLPRYLQTSVKSCHDFSKYGRKHDFEGKESIHFFTDREIILSHLISKIRQKLWILEKEGRNL